MLTWLCVLENHGKWVYFILLNEIQVVGEEGPLQGDLTTGGVSIRFVLILWLPYNYFYGACKSELIRFHIKFLFFY